jgi:hypothetical protein
MKINELIMDEKVKTPGNGYYWAWFDTGDSVRCEPVNCLPNGKVEIIGDEILGTPDDLGIVAFEDEPIDPPTWPNDDA